MGVRSLPFFKRKNGLQFAGIGQDTSGGGGQYVLPIATTSTLGGVKVGFGVSVDPSTGVLSVTIQAATLPAASADLVDVIVQYVGATDTYTNGYFYKCVSDGLDPATYSWAQTNVQPQYTLPTASASTLGGVKVGSNLSIDSNGVLSASTGGTTILAEYTPTSNTTYSAVISELYSQLSGKTLPDEFYLKMIFPISGSNFETAILRYSKIYSGIIEFTGISMGYQGQSVLAYGVRLATSSNCMCGYSIIAPNSITYTDFLNTTYSANRTATIFY